MAKKTEKELREKMEDAIDSLHEIATAGASAEGKSQLQVSASNALANMIRTYKETFGVTPENPEKLKSIKNF